MCKKFKDKILVLKKIMNSFNCSSCKCKKKSKFFNKKIKVPKNSFNKLIQFKIIIYENIFTNLSNFNNLKYNKFITKEKDELYYKSKEFKLEFELQI